MSTEEIVKAIQGQINLAKRLGNPNIFFSISEGEILIALLKEHEPKPIVNKWHKNPLGDYSRLHCPWCDRELDMQSAKEYVACPYCGRSVKWDV